METNPLLVTSFANIFSQSLGSLFGLFIVSFAVQKLLNLIGLVCFCFHLGFLYLFLYSFCIVFCIDPLFSSTSWLTGYDFFTDLRLHLCLLNCGVGEDLESPLDSKEIQPGHPKGDQS